MNKRFKECLLDVYHAEQTGEVIFESMLRYAQNKEERFILGSMLQLETEAKAIMRPSLVQLELLLLTHQEEVEHIPTQVFHLS